MNRLSLRRLFFGMWIAAFAIGTATHILELLSYGWMPYRFAPLAFNLFWTSLTFVDPLVVLLLPARRRAGAALGLAVILADVAANSYALYGLGIAELAGPLQAQSLFLGFALGSLPLIWTDES